MPTNPDDVKREQILKYLYERHKSARGISKIPIGIRDLQKEMKKRYNMTQQDVASNLDYLVQVGWVKQVIKERSITTKSGMELSQEQIKYKISDIGINYLQSGTLFKKTDTSNHVNITNIQGVTIVGDGNVVNTEFVDLFNALDLLGEEISNNTKLSDEHRLDAAGDIATLKTQIAKKNPNKHIIRSAWDSLKAISTIAGVTQAVEKVGKLIELIF